MLRRISKKRARYLEKRGEFVYRGINGYWLWSRVVEYLNRWKYDYAVIGIVETGDNKSRFTCSKAFIPDCKIMAYNQHCRNKR